MQIIYYALFRIQPFFNHEIHPQHKSPYESNLYMKPERPAPARELETTMKCKNDPVKMRFSKKFEREYQNPSKYGRDNSIIKKFSLESGNVEVLNPSIFGRHAARGKKLQTPTPHITFSNSLKNVFHLPGSRTAFQFSGMYCILVYWILIKSLILSYYSFTTFFMGKFHHC